jgi:hypothetical protein
MKKDYTIEKKIAKAVAKGKTAGIIEDKDGTIYFWDLTVNVKE